MSSFVVAIDGPAGSGKSTVAKKLAKEFSFTYLDTGAMYRAFTYHLLRKKIDFKDLEKIDLELNKISIDLFEEKVSLNDEDVSEVIRGVEVTNNVSKVASIKIVREKLVEWQRECSRDKRAILDGRDIGTVVFPNAELKIFLIASPEERADRRKKEYESKGIEVDYNKLLSEIEERDKMDRERIESPLKKADDAVEVDTTGLGIEKVVEIISKMIKEAKEDSKG